MSQYATIADLELLGLPAAALGSVSADVKNAHLTAASELADSYFVARGYAIPLASWGTELRQAIAQIAAWTLLINNRGVNPEDPSTAAIARAHDQALAWIKDVGRNDATLNAAKTAPAAAPAARVRTAKRRGW